MKQSNYTIVATLGDDVERIVELDFLDADELLEVQTILEFLYESCNKYNTLQDSMSEEEWYAYEKQNGVPEYWTPHPYFVFNNTKHKELLAYITLADIGIQLCDYDVPDVFNRKDTINLTGLVI